MATRDVRKANKRLALTLAGVTLAMFAFGYALSPLYDAMCKVMGTNGKTAGQVDAQTVSARKVDANRTVTVEFTGLATTGLPWEFRPLTKKLELHPGEVAEVRYLVRNDSDETVVGQAVPSVTPGESAAAFRKIECFCFSQQTLKPHETREMPVRFYVDASLDGKVQVVTLSYTFFNTDKEQAAKFGGQAVAANDHEHSHHAPARTPGG